MAIKENQARVSDNLKMKNAQQTKKTLFYSTYFNIHNLMAVYIS